MPINLLASAPPHVEAPSRQAAGADERAPSTPTFGASVAAATGAQSAPKPRNPAHPNPAPSRPNAPAAEETATPDAAALLLVLAPRSGVAADPAQSTSTMPDRDSRDPAAASTDGGSSTEPASRTDPATPIIGPCGPFQGEVSRLVDTARSSAAAAAAGAAPAPPHQEGLRPSAPRVPTVVEPNEQLRASADRDAVATSLASVAASTRVADATVATRDGEQPRPAARDAATETTPVGGPDVLTRGPAPLELTITTPALTPAWREQVVAQIAQIVVMRHDRAEIRLNPSELGPITVHIEMQGSQANLLIEAPQPATRDALDLALGQLRESLAHQGITLGQATVQGDAQAPQDRGRDTLPADAAPVAGRAESPPPIALRVLRGLVDLYA